MTRILFALVGFLAMVTATTAQMPAATSEGLQRILDTNVKLFPANAGVWVRHLKTGVEAGFKADETFNSASVIKLAVLVLAYRMADNGELALADRVTISKQDIRGGSGIFRYHDPGLQPTIRDVLLQMVITSDNTATDIAIAKVGGVARVNAWLKASGYEPGMRLTQTTGELFAKYAALPQGANRNEKTNGDRAYWLGEMTPRATGRLLEDMQNCSSDPAGESATRLASTSACDDMLRMMRAQQAGARRLPHFVSSPIAHKTGDFPPVLANDVGIVYSRRGPIVIAFFTNAITAPYWAVEDQMGRFAELVLEYLDR